MTRQSDIDFGPEKIIGFFIPSRIDQGIKTLRSFYTLRMIPFEQELRRNNLRGFYYCPADIDFNKGAVKGYLIGDKEFLKTELKTPHINCDFLPHLNKFIREQNINFSDFQNSCTKHHIQIYPMRSIERIVVNKYKTYKTLQEVANINQAYTETYTETGEQLTKFLDKYKTAYLKPNFGNKSELIIFLEKRDGKIFTEYYPKNYYNEPITEQKYCDTEAEAAEYLKKYTSLNDYIIQEGIDVLKHNDSVIKFRVVTMFDGETWQKLYIIGRGNPNSAVSNTLRIRGDFKAEEFLNEFFDQNTTTTLINQVVNQAITMSSYFDALYPETVPELAYDFLIDKNRKIYVCEVNTRPAMPVPGTPDFPRSGVFDILPDEEELYQNYVIPYGTYLAKFYVKKLQKTLRG